MSMRIGGLASGMDIDTMVSDLMKAERLPLNKLKQKKQVLEWQRDDYRSINTLLLNFRTELTNMRLSSTYRSRITTSTDETRVTATATSAASMASYSITEVKKIATAATKVNAGKLSGETSSKVDPSKSLSDIEENFKNVFTWGRGTVESQTLVSPANGEPIKLSLKTGIEVNTTEKINVNVNGVAYEVLTSTSDILDPTKNQVKIDKNGNLQFSGNVAKDSSIKVDFIANHRVQEQTMAEMGKIVRLSDDAKHSASSITSVTVRSGTASPVTYSFPRDVNGNPASEIRDSNNKLIVRVNKTTGELEFGSDITKDAKIEINYEQKYSVFNLATTGADGLEKKENFYVSGTDSLNSVISKVNSSSLGVTMFYDSVSDQMTLTRKDTGDFNKLGDEIRTGGDFIDNVLQFKNVIEKGGDNAEFTINGLETQRTSNTFEISGVTFTLKKAFTLETSPTPVNINITNNTNQIFDNIKGFVTKYNELIAKIQGEVQEERYKNYTPLTDEQRETLSDKQQEQWEEKAKSGLLRRDPTLSALLTKMRSNFSTPVSNSDISPMFKQLTSIGIKTTVNYLEGGKLEIDEAALKKAIETDPSSIEKLFNSSGTTDGDKGIAQRLTDTVTASLEKLRSKAGNSFSTNRQFEIGKLLNDVDSKISRFEDRLIKVEDRYWARFTAMEKAIQRSNEQMSQLLNYNSSSY